MNKIFIRSILIFLISLTIFFYPWRSSITIPSVYESAHTVDIYPSEEAVVEKVFISPKQFVNKNDNLIVIGEKDQYEALSRNAFYATIKTK